MCAICAIATIPGREAIRCCQVGRIVQSGGAAAARSDLVLVGAGLQHLPDGISVLPHAELVKPRPHFFPVFEEEA